MRAFPSIVALSWTLLLMGCPTMPDTATNVLGFSTNCGKGATALITQVTRKTDDHEPSIAIDPTSVRDGDEKLAIGFHWHDDHAPFVVKIHQTTACIFASSHPTLVIEANCYQDYSPHASCQARLNFQGLRPAPEGYPPMDIPQHLVPGEYPATPPEELFTEPNLFKANERERQRLGNKMDMTTAFEDQYHQDHD